MITINDLYKKYATNLINSNDDYFGVYISKFKGDKNKSLDIYSLKPITKKVLEDQKQEAIYNMFLKKDKSIKKINQLKDIENKIKEYDKLKTRNLHQIADQEEYKKVVQEFCKIAEDKLIAGEKVYFGNIGYFNIIKANKTSDVKKLRVDWGESNKAKQEIINKGLIPMSKDTPDGVPYIRYHNPDELYYCVNWHKNRQVANIICYKYLVANDSSSNSIHLLNFKRKVKQAVKNPLAHLIYKFNGT